MLLVALCSAWQVIEANIYYFVTMYYSLEGQNECPEAFKVFVKVHNYVFY